MQMFGYRAEELLNRRRRERWEAKKAWPFLTDRDLQSIRSSADLCDIVSVRKNISKGAAKEMVQAWMQGYWNRLRAKPPLEACSPFKQSITSAPARPDW